MARNLTQYHAAGVPVGGLPAALGPVLPRAPRMDVPAQLPPVVAELPHVSVPLSAVLVKVADIMVTLGDVAPHLPPVLP